MKKLLVTIIAIATLSTTALASEEYACVQYQRKDNSWGDPYKVPATVVSGDKVLEATNDQSYSSFKNYAIVEWPNGGYSAMELPSFQDDLPLFSYRNTKDQNGRTYRIKEAPSYGRCESY